MTELHQLDNDLPDGDGQPARYHQGEPFVVVARREQGGVEVWIWGPDIEGGHSVIASFTDRDEAKARVTVERIYPGIAYDWVQWDTDYAVMRQRALANFAADYMKKYPTVFEPRGLRKPNTPRPTE